MKVLLKMAVVGAIALGLSSTVAQADVAKGQKIFIKKLKQSCGFTGGVMAGKHTQAEWTKIYNEGKLNDELLKHCPNAKKVKDKFLPHLYDFFHNYASDSGNVPAC